MNPRARFTPGAVLVKPGPPPPRTAAGYGMQLPVVAAYDPPQADPPPPQPPALAGRNTDYEAWTMRAQIGRAAAETPVYTTTRKWSACDVYLQSDATIPISGVLSIFIYAVSQQGAKTLIASGRFGHFGSSVSTSRPEPRWIAAARASAERFLVTVQYTDTAVPNPDRVFNLTVVASDEPSDPPFLAGAIGMGNFASAGAIFIAGGGPVFIPKPRMLRVEAFNFAGGTPAAPVARFLHLHDVNTNAVAGLAPLFVWPLGNQDGDGGAWDLDYRAYQSFVLAPSSTAATTTLVADCMVQGLIQ